MRCEGSQKSGNSSNWLQGVREDRDRSLSLLERGKECSEEASTTSTKVFLTTAWDLGGLGAANGCSRPSGKFAPKNNGPAAVPKCSAKVVSEDESEGAVRDEEEVSPCIPRHSKSPPLPAPFG